MPGPPSWQSNPSAAPVPVHDPHETSFCPVTLTHLPLPHWLSPVQKQVPDAEQAPPALLQPPFGQAQLVADGAVSVQLAPSQDEGPSGASTPFAFASAASSGSPTSAPKTSSVALSVLTSSAVTASTEASAHPPAQSVEYADRPVMLAHAPAASEQTTSAATRLSDTFHP
jgi:hypothetical protein